MFTLPRKFNRSSLFFYWRSNKYFPKFLISALPWETRKLLERPINFKVLKIILSRDLLILELILRFVLESKTEEA